MADQWSEWAIIQLDGPFYQPLACTTVIVGREGGDIIIQSRGVDRRQALLQYDQTDRGFRLRDLSSTAGTWVNDKLLADQSHVRLQHCDTLRFGTDPSVYQIRRVNTGTPPQRRVSPAWTDVRLTECQGCIREQELQHTCDLRPEKESLTESVCTCRHDSPSHASTMPTHGEDSPSHRCSMPCNVPSTLTDATVPSPPAEELLSTEPSDSSRTFDPGRCNGDPFEPINDSPHNEYNKDSSSGSTSSSPRCQKTLCTSLSSASIHSNFSEDSLIDHRDRSPPKSTAPLPTIQQENDTSAKEEESEDEHTGVGMLGLMGTGPQKAWWESEPDTPPKRPPPSPEKKRVAQATKKESEPPPQRQQSTKYDNVYMEVPVKKDAENKEDEEDPQDEKKPPSMAFIIDFGDGGGAGTKRSPKIGDSLSKFVPRHRRNQSLSRAEEIRNKSREKEEKAPCIPKKPGPGGSKKPITPADTPKRRSSIQEKFPPDKLQQNQEKNSERSHVIHDSRGRKIHKQPAEKPLSPDRTVQPTRIGDVNSSAQYLIDKMFSSAPDAHAVFGNSDKVHIPPEVNPPPEMLQYKPNLGQEELSPLPPPPPRTLQHQQQHYLPPTPPQQQQKCAVAAVKDEFHRYQYYERESAPPNRQCAPVSTMDSGYSGYTGAEEEDTVSEAGTYTIEKDDQPTDDARRDIDRVFGMLSDEEPLSPLDEGRGSDSPASDTRQKNAAWIREWAVQVARHQQPQGPKDDRLRPKGSSPSAPTPPFSSPVGTLSKPPHSAKALLSSSGESQARPRRMLPVPPARSQAPQPHPSSDLSENGDSPKSKEDRGNGGRKSDSSLEAEKFLRDAESVVAAMQMRVSQMEEQGSPEPHTPPTRTPPGRRPQGSKNSWSEHSDSSCSELADTNPQPAITMRFNRAFSLRRAQAQAESVSVSKAAARVERKPQSGSQQRSSSYAKMRRASEGRGSRHSVSSEREVNCGFNRSDGGRFSLRMRSVNSPMLQGSVKGKASSKQPPTSAGVNKKKDAAAPPRRPNAPPRSGSSLSAKEVEFQNWKRRKDYDPMRAAQQGRKNTAKRSTTQPIQQPACDRMTTSLTGSGHSTPSPPILRSASFHGTDGMGTPTRSRKSTYVTQQQQQQQQQQKQQKQQQHHVQHHRRQQEAQYHYQEMNNISRHSSRNSNISGMSSDFADDEEPPVRKNSVDESRGSMPTFSRGSPASSSLRGKAKLEALDSLVFGTIFSVSSKLQVAAVSILDKLKKQMSDDCDLIGKIEDTLIMVSQPDGSSGESGSPTRPLATTLKNLRKVEQTLVLLDEVLSVDLRDAPEAEASYLCKPWNGFDAEESC